MANERYKSSRDYLTFQNLDELPRQIFDILLEQEDLFRLLAYDDSNPLSSSNPNLTIEEKTDLIFNRIQQDNARVYFMSFADNVEDNEQTQLRIYVRNINIEQDNIGDVMFSVDIITHNNLVILGDGSNRLLKMLPEVVRALNGYNAKFSISQLQMPIGGNLPLLYYNKNFQGYSIPIRARVNNGSVCQIER